MGELDTKNKILNAAEKLFAQKGFEATSLREITTEAGVNLAAIGYHFKSKEGLLGEVYLRHIVPLNKERLRLLDEAEAKAGDKPPPLEEVLRAMVEPILRFARASSQGTELFMRLYGRMYTEQSDFLKNFFTEHFQEVIHRFMKALQRVLPHLGMTEFMWRTRFVVGALLHTMYDPFEKGSVHGIKYEEISIESVIEQLVNFMAAGLKTPALLNQEPDAQ